MRVDRFVWRRLVSVVPVLLGISFLTFCLMYFSPGDPAELSLEQSGVIASAAEVARLREKWGLDEPWYVQYGMWLKGVLSGDAGVSYRTGHDVFEEIFRHLPTTAALSAAALLWTSTVGILWGAAIVLWRERAAGRALKGLVQAFLSLPSFLLSLLFVLVFAEWLQVLPSHGADSVESFVLPSLALASITTAMVAQFSSGRILEELAKPYCQVAAARGMRAKKVVLTYALPNALPPVLAMLGNYFGAVLGGSVVVETIFALPGVGSLAMEAIRFRDYPLLQGYVLFAGTMFVLVSLAVDLLLHALDSRVSMEGRRR